MDRSPFPCLACEKYFDATPEFYKVCPPCRAAKYCSLCKSGTGVHIVDCFHDAMICSKNHPSPNRTPARRPSPILIAPATPPARVRRIPVPDLDDDETVPATPNPSTQTLPVYPVPHRAPPLHHPAPTTPAQILFPQLSNQDRLLQQSTAYMNSVFQEQDAKIARENLRARQRFEDQLVRSENFRQAALDARDAPYVPGDEADTGGDTYVRRVVKKDS